MSCSQRTPASAPGSAGRGTQPVESTPASRKRGAPAAASPPSRAVKRAHTSSQPGDAAAASPSTHTELVGGTPRLTPAPTPGAPALPEPVDDGDACVPAGVDPSTAGGEQSPVPLHAALALLHRRLLCTSDSADDDGVELSPQLRDNHLKLVDMLEDTLAGSQNNSVLLLGPRGSGKSLVLRRALRDVTARHGGGVVPVRLSGLLHADERVALRELARQLDDRGAGASAASADAASGLLSRVSELDALALMAGYLKHLERSSRSAIFVLDDFDAFAPATRKQTLLYNLMDALQASAVRAVVVGVSACCNAADMLEKRVRSRFSHRRLVFTPSSGDVLPSLRRLLTLPRRGFGAGDGGAFADAWNDSLDRALGAPAVRAAVATAASYGGLPRLSAAIAMHALSRVAGGGGGGGSRPRRGGGGVVEEHHVVGAVAAAVGDPFQVHLQHLPKAHLLLLVAARRLHAMRQQPVFTFGAVFRELSAMYASPKFPSDCVMPRDVALGAFEALAQAGAFEHADSAAAAAAGGAWLKEHAAYALVVADSELREAMVAHKALPSDTIDFLTHETVAPGAGAPAL